LCIDGANQLKKITCSGLQEVFLKPLASPSGRDCYSSFILKVYYVRVY